MTPLRQRFLDDLHLRNYSPRTQKTYLDHVVRFARHFGRSPDQLGPEDDPHLSTPPAPGQHASWSVFNQAVCALRFLYRVTLQAPFAVDMIPYGKKPKTLPAVLSRDEVARLFACVPQPLERLMLQTTYACGLRASEVLRLQVTDIDSSRMLLWVRHGKGDKDRCVPLSPALLEAAAAALAAAPADDLAVSRPDAERPAFAGRVAAGLPAGRAGRAASPRRRACTRCGTVTPRTCWRPASIW